VLLAQRTGVPKVSTGDMLREAIAAGTPLGRQAAPVMERGDLVPDELLIGIVRERLARPDTRNGYILDGFPRTVRQAEGLAEMDADVREGRLVVINVTVPRHELLRRLSGRRLCPKCQATYLMDTDPPRRDQLCDRDGALLIQREDDKEHAVARRLAEYEQRTAPLINYYRSRASFHEVDGHRPVENVFERLSGILEGRE
jgi:adenylate kinase